MGKYIDLTGQQFGRLTALYRVPDTRPTKWHCRCECGKEVDVNASNLRRGLTKSCGCLHGEARRGKPTGKHIDLTGQRFGRLTALEFVKHDTWTWRCDCGNVVTARPSLVKAGEISSCGCLQKERRRETISGQVGHVDGTSLSVIRSIVNGKVRKNSSTGVTGVKIRYNQSAVVYVAKIMYQGKEIHLGTFATLEEAAAVRKDAERKYFGQALADHDTWGNKQ